MDQPNEVQDQTVQSSQTATPQNMGSTSPEVQINTTQTQPEPPTQPKKKLISGKVAILLTAIVILATAGGLVFYLQQVRNNKNQTQQNQSDSSSTQDTATQTETVADTGPLPAVYVKPIDLELDVTWQTPTKVASLGYFLKEAPFDTQDIESSTAIEYYLAGTFKGGKVYYANISVALGYAVFPVVVKDDGSKATVLYRYLSSMNYNNKTVEMLATENKLDTSKAVFDLASVFKNTSAQKSITVKGQAFRLPSVEYKDGNGSSTFYNELYGSINFTSSNPEEKRTTISTNPQGIVREVTVQKDGYSLNYVEVELPNHFVAKYELDNEMNIRTAQPITWSDSTTNSAVYSSFGFGCGGAVYSLVAGITQNEVVTAGMLKSGREIYQFKDFSTKVSKQILSEVNARGEENYIDEKSPPYTEAEFVKDRAAVIIKDDMGRFIVYKNANNFIQGGCAKPVVYLYPTETTKLDISIGADVSISDPHYEVNGWQNVTAYPDGTLSYRGSMYDSLFWEGKAHGRYPDVTSTGVVVPRSQVVGMMYLQLAQQGFNAKESFDFVQFWSRNIPAGKYVRLSWLTTAQVNELAPITISKQPATVIRTFLDMEGYNTPLSLTPQTFTAPERKGFTLTEWGGLARDGLQALR